MHDELLELFPVLAGLDKAEQGQLRQSLVFLTLPAKAVPFRPGNSCERYLFILSGSIRVQLVSETGREIVLYRVERGETCILTTTCLMANETYPAEAVAETEVRVAALPRTTFRRLLASSEPFRTFVFSSFSQRIGDLLLAVSQVAFRRIDLRLARYLLANADAEGSLHLSHYELAVELGTVREVVSRQLKEFERRHWIALQRRRIDIIDYSALRRVVAENRL